MRTTRLQNFMVLALSGVKILPQDYLWFPKQTLILNFSQTHLCALMA